MTYTGKKKVFVVVGDFVSIQFIKILAGWHICHHKKMKENLTANDSISIVATTLKV